ncbi:hypothetical protein [uncultured Desulfovibrio sp.]|uniref:hypothetical protein n=1 Tax=uncultured Desulfovibrio sp. TaxID=167968 RepID=UPI0025E10CB7|nr:hypothetical protein [uncultured Desulfovibrio sp.]
MSGRTGRTRAGRAFAGAVAALLCCALLTACAGQRLEVKPRGQTVFSVGAGGR